MPRVTRSALVPYSPVELFELVRDVPSYPDFLGWVQAAQVHSEDEHHQVASLEVRLGGMVKRFTTLNRFEPGRRLSMELHQGPFEDLRGSWTFEPIGGGTRVSLDLNFELPGSVLLTPFRQSFGRVADRMVDDFSRRAETVYG